MGQNRKGFLAAASRDSVCRPRTAVFRANRLQHFFCKEKKKKRKEKPRYTAFHSAPATPCSAAQCRLLQEPVSLFDTQSARAMTLPTHPAVATATGTATTTTLTWEGVPVVFPALHTHPPPAGACSLLAFARPPCRYRQRVGCDDLILVGMRLSI
jgi:hypothetical protein